TRGSGISSDVESTIVPQFPTEADGVEGLPTVVVIGASNRPDLIDPAILRPGRLDVKIKVERPDRTSAGDIFHKYVTRDLPIAAAEIRLHGDIQAALDAMIESALEAVYRCGEDNRFLEVTYASGDKEVLYFKDFSSGAMIESVVRRAKKFALKRCIATGRWSDRAERRPQNTRRERQSMCRFVMAAVVIELQSTTQGASLKLGTEGLRLTLAN